MDVFALDKLIVSSVISVGVFSVGALCADKATFSTAGETIASIFCATSGDFSVVESSETNIELGL